MKAQKVVIFDFDGTLADVAPLIKKLYAEIAPARKWPELTPEAYAMLRKGTVREALRWVGVRPWQLAGLMREGRSLFHASSADVQLFKGIPELINHLRQDGWHIYILSNNSNLTIHEVLKRNNSNDGIHVMKRPTLFGKATSIRNLVRVKKYARENVWMIGDEVRDIVGAQKAGVRSIAVTWGLQDESLLRGMNPTHVATKVSDVKTFLNQEKG